MADRTSGEAITVPVGLLTSLRDEYLRGHCPIKGGWGDSATIESLLELIPKTQAIRSLIPDAVWEVCVWLPGSNYLTGIVDGADRTKIIDAVLAAAESEVRT